MAAAARVASWAPAGAGPALRGPRRPGTGARAGPGRGGGPPQGRPTGRTGDGARHHRRAGPRLPAGDGGLRGRELHPPRRAEHPRAGGAGAAGALRAPDGELPRQRAGAARSRWHPGGRRRAAVPGALRAARPAGRPCQPGKPRGAVGPAGVGREPAERGPGGAAAARRGGPSGTAESGVRGMTPVVLLHFHGRRTGVTRHVEDVARRLPAVVTGWGPLRDVRRIPWRALLARARSGPVVVHAHRNFELLSALLLRWMRPSVRVVFTRHSAGRPSAWTRFLARRADARVVLTRVALRELGLRAEVVPHGVDVARFSPPADRDESWRALGVGGSHGLGAVGRIRPAKGQQDLAAAWVTLGPRFKSWRAVLAGL